MGTPGRDRAESPASTAASGGNGKRKRRAEYVLTITDLTLDLRIPLQLPAPEGGVSHPLQRLEHHHGTDRVLRHRLGRRRHRLRALKGVR